MARKVEHRIVEIKFSEGALTCTCTEQVKAIGVAGRKVTPEGLQAAFQEHRRRVGVGNFDLSISHDWAPDQRAPEVYRTSLGISKLSPAERARMRTKPTPAAAAAT